MGSPTCHPNTNAISSVMFASTASVRKIRFTAIPGSSAALARKMKWWQSKNRAAEELFVFPYGSKAEFIKSQKKREFRISKSEKGRLNRHGLAFEFDSSADQLASVIDVLCSIVWSITCPKVLFCISIFNSRSDFVMRPRATSNNRSASAFGLRELQIDFCAFLWRERY